MPLPILGMLAGAASTAANYYLTDKQNEKNTERQSQANREMALYNHNLQLDMWKKTGPEAQKEQYEKAGLNPALMYGMGGGGGQTAGSGTGAGVSSGATGNYDTAANVAQLGLMDAQRKNIEAQTEASKAEAQKKEAETAKLQGVDTDKATQETRAAKFQNDLNDLITKDKMLDRYVAETDIKEIEATRANGEWEAYKAAGWKGKTFDDPNSPIAKALGAGWDKAVTDLENAKKEGNIKEAETIVKRFEANMAEKGLDPKAPWYTKFIADLLEKVGVKLF